MNRVAGFLLTVFGLLVLQGLAHDRAVTARNQLSAVEEVPYALPAEMLQVVALEFKGLVADRLFLDGLTFIGKAFERRSINQENGWTEEPLLSDRQWDWFVAQMGSSTTLDPWFLDPYYLGNTNLVWEAHRYEEANQLLKKGIRYRSWDWMLPFNAGFNAFFFLGDKHQGASYLMQAAERPDAPALLATLAARLAYEGNDTANAIIFLKQILRDSEGGGVDLTLIRERLSALEAIAKIESAVDEYRRQHSRAKHSLKDLIESGILKALPLDPYGGRYYLGLDGKVKSTSDLGKRGT